MKKKILLALSIVIVVVISCTMLFGCSNSKVLEGKEYDEQVEYYESIKADVQKNAPLLNSLMDKLIVAKWSAKFVSSQTYYYTANDTKKFKGTAENAGYDNNGKDETPWYTQAITYIINYDCGAVYIEAQIHQKVEADSFSETKLPPVESTIKYLKTANGEERGDISIYNATVAVMFGDLSQPSELEKYVSSIDSGFRLISSMMQYQVVRPYAYTADGYVDKTNVIDYTQNKGKLKYSMATGSTAGDEYTYFDDYKDDINYNFEKISEVHNERVTMTYKKNKSLINTYEYLEEIVLPYYTIKDDFNKYNVLKCRVADYTHWVATFDYESPVSIPAVGDFA